MANRDIPILQHPLNEPSAFKAETLVAAVRTERNIHSQSVPRICVLEFDGDLTDWLVKTGTSTRTRELGNMLSLHRESRAPSSVKLSELLEGVVALVDETIAKGRRRIEVVPGFAGEVEAFPSELRQVFTNVLKNAVEATSDNGEIRVYYEAAQEAGLHGVLVRVVDNGGGIPAELQSKLFNPFVSTKEESGTGLGLWVSRSILEKHGGSIQLSSGAGHRGTTVSIFLPLKVQSQAPNRSESEARTEAAS